MNEPDPRPRGPSPRSGSPSDGPRLTGSGAGFTLPLSREAFRAALARGHGRALLHARAHPERVEDDTLLEAMLFDLAYDSQCSERATWVRELLDAVGERKPLLREFIRRAPKLPARDNEWWDVNLRCELLLRMAKRDEPGAAEALRALVQPRRHSASTAGLPQILELDGEAGLLLACERALARVERGWSDTPNADPLEEWDRERGFGSARGILLAQPEGTAARRYADTVDRPEPPRPPGPRPRRPRSGPLAGISGAEAVARVREGQRLRDRWLAGWAAEAEPAELAEVAAAFAGEDKPDEVTRWLGFWSERTLPFVTDAFLAALSTPGLKGRGRLFVAAGGAIDARLRPMTEEERTPDAVRDQSLCRFGARMREQDVAQALRLHAEAARPSSPEDDDPHPMSCTLIDLAGWNPGVDTSPLLLRVYERGACEIRRERAIEHLIRLGRLPHWLEEEIAQDASAGVRRIMGRQPADPAS